MKKVVIWYRPVNCGDGSAAIRWYLTEEQAEEEYENDYEGFAESGVSSVETFKGSDIHKEAVENSK